MPVYDLSKVGEGLPEGNFVMMLTKVTPKTAKSGSEMLLLELTVADEEDGKSDYNGQKTWRNLVLQENTLPFVKLALKAFECDPEIFDTAIDPEVELRKLIGNKALVTMGPATSGGPNANEVKKMAPVPFE